MRAKIFSFLAIGLSIFFTVHVSAYSMEQATELNFKKDCPLPQRQQQINLLKEEDKGSYYLLGLHHLLGQCVKANTDKALVYFLRSAENGQSMSIIMVGIIYSHYKNDPDNAYQWMQQFVSNNFSSSDQTIRKTAEKYLLGLPAPEELDKALNWRKHLNNKNPEDKYLTGTQWLEKHTGDITDDIALILLTDAAFKRNSPADIGLAKSMARQKSYQNFRSSPFKHRLPDMLATKEFWQHTPWEELKRKLSALPPTSRDIQGNTLILISMTYCRNPDIIKFLADMGVDINAPNNEGDFPLRQAIWYDYKMVLPLLRNGANPNQLTDKGRSILTSAIDLAAVHKTDATLQNIKHLIAYGANPHLKDKTGRTARDYFMDYPSLSQNKELQKILAPVQ